MTKKLLALIVALSMCLCFFAPGINAQTDSSYTDELSMLDCLNIGDFTSSSQAVTRGQFVSALSDIINYNNRPLPKNGGFGDVGEANPQSGAIYSICDMGIISGYSDTVFGIDDPITYEQAIKILVSAMGYDLYAQSYGGYPTGYMRIASEKDLSRGVGAAMGKALTQGEAAALIVNAIDADILVQTSFGNSYVYEAFEGRTLLSEYAKIKKIEGIITDNGITSLLGETKAMPGKLVIDGKAYFEGNSGASCYLGYKVIAYAKEDSYGNDTIVYAMPHYDSETEIVLAERIVYEDDEFSLKNIVYEDVYGNLTEAKIDSEADFIYNGKAYADITKKDLDLEFGKLTLINNDTDSAYDVVLVQEERIFALSATNTEKNAVYPFGDSALVLGDDIQFKIYRDGKECTINDLVQWDVINAQISLDEEVITLRASSAKVSGQVESYIYSTNTVRVGEKYYHVNTKELMDKIKLGTNYEFCIDIDGNIADIKSSLITSQKVGILVAAKQKSGIDTTVNVKIFNSDGLMEVYKLAPKAVIDYDNTRTLEEAALYLGGDQSTLKYTIITYKLNSDGEIVFIQSPSAAKYESDLRLDYTSGKSKIAYSGYQFSFGGKAVMDADTVVFKLPQDLSEEDRFASLKRNNFAHEKQYIINAYSIGDDTGFSDYIVYSDDLSSTFTSGETPMVISEIKSVLDIDGMPKECIKGFNYQSELEYTAETPGMFDGLECGDVIRCIVNDKLEIVDYQLVLKGSTFELNNTITNNADKFTGSPRFTTFDVYKKSDNVLTVSREELSGDVDETKLDTEKMVYANQKIYIFNPEERQVVTTGTINDIYDYKSVGEDHSKIFVYSHYGSIRMIVIYEN